MGYFHARYVQNTDCPVGREYGILHLRGAQGKYVGSNCTLQSGRNGAGLFFLEGAEKITCDTEKGPSRWLGTGTEAYFNGAYCWNHPNKAAMVRPLGGLTLLDWGAQRVCGYRFQVVDWVPFRESVRVDLEHGGTNEVPANYRSVAYYYLDRPLPQAELPVAAERGLTQVRLRSGFLAP